MVVWNRFIPADFEYDFERDKLAGHGVAFEEAAAVTLTGDLAPRAAFLARIHREKSLKSWLLRIIRERIELEEGAFVEAKRELGLKAPAL